MLIIRRLVAAAGVPAVAAALLAVPAAPAAAQADCGYQFATAPNGDEVVVWTCADGAGSGGGGDGGGRVCETTTAEGTSQQVPCVDSTFGWFTNANGGCYIQPASPQPPAGDPAWEGNDPADGTVYTAVCPRLGGVDGESFTELPTTIFLPDREADLMALLEQAIAQLPLRGPDIRLAPDQDGAGLVGLPVWMWTPVTESTWGEATASLSSLGVVLSVAANGERISWDMGDGGVVECHGPGRAYRPEYGADDGPCTYRYDQPSRSRPDGRYQVTATTHWRIDWWIEGTTITGVETRTREATASVRINELQVVTS